MARTYSPLMSLDASGTVGDAITFSKWKGRSYVRTRVTPANPQTPAQWGMRSIMKALAQAWAGLSSSDQASWEELAKNESISPFNAFTALNLRRHRDTLGARTPPDPTPNFVTGHINATLTGASGRNISITINWTTATDAWLAYVYMSTTTGFTPTWSNCRLVIPCLGQTTVTASIGPLNPGDYFLRYKLTSTAGVLDASYSTEDTVTIA